MTVPITLRGLRKDFGSGAKRTRAVDDVSIEIVAGELFFLLGPSGCGKTTLLRMIAGFIDPTDGLIRFGKREVTHLEPNKRNTGMVFQSYALWPHMTVEQNVAFGLGVRKVGGAEKSRRVTEALRTVQMEQYGARKPNELSGGQQQRVALARALVVRPDVLLLDEPLSNLDAKLRIELRAQIRRVCKEAGITTVYVTHDQKEALSMADRIAIMRSGLVVQVGTPLELYRNPATRFAAEFLGETNIVPGKVVETGAVARVETSFGVLHSTHPSRADVNYGDKVLCSLRPEGVTLTERRGSDGAAHNTYRGRLIETTYLGEIAQHVIDVGNNQHLRSAELNPAQLRTHASGGPAETPVSIDPADVVLLTE